MPDPGDLAVVVPTRDRWPVVARTLDALSRQTAPGFETIVVVDGTDQTPPPLLGARVLVKPHGGPGAARNHAARATERPLLLFLGDDMIPAPDLVERHLVRHAALDEDQRIAVLGRAEWHPEVPATPLLRWIDRSGFQFDYATIAGADASWAHFYSSNVSLHRRFFLDAGGFDEDFVYYYEDLDCGWRLGQLGMRLVFEPDAVTRHLHAYDWDMLVRRFRGIAVGERLMAEKHPWFTPWFRQRLADAIAEGQVSAVWPRLARVSAILPDSLAAAVDRNADRRCRQLLARPFDEAWEGDRDLAELRRYLGDAFDQALLESHQSAVEREEDAAPDEATFYRTSQSYLYDLTVFAMSGTKTPYLDAIESVVAPGARLLDYGCGIGADGLRLLERGYRVSFADFDNPSTTYLRWRLAQRGLDAAVFDVDGAVPGGFDLAYAFDVIEHVEDPIAFLDALERRAGLVAVNLLEPDPNDVHLHRPLPIAQIVERAHRSGLVHYRRHHGRSHLLVYRSPTSDAPRRRVRSAIERRVGPTEAARTWDRVRPVRGPRQLHGAVDHVLGAVRHRLAAVGVGSTVECPCCGGRFAAFAPFGVVPRPNAQCPGCGALERHRLLSRYLRERTPLFARPHRVLHVAAEPALSRLVRVAPGVRYVTADLAADADVRLDLTRLPFADATFDAVICNHVLEHVPDDKAAMAELRRVLAPDGWAILQVPLDDERAETFEDPGVRDPVARERLFGRHDHVRVYGRDYSERLEAAGFRVVVDPYVRSLPADEVARHGLRDDEHVHLCFNT
jgi:2-polyprenyl-3-methyl-5-hydroxy-6-metoxy-1,4-benzoquinol methylase